MEPTMPSLLDIDTLYDTSDSWDDDIYHIVDSIDDDMHSSNGYSINSKQEPPPPR